MKRIIYLFFISCVCFSLSACDRRIPSAGEVYIPNLKRSFAETYLVGYNLHLMVKNASGVLSGHKGQHLLGVFMLGSRYKLYQAVYDHRTLLDDLGSYHYVIDHYEPHEGMLNLVGRKNYTMDILLTYKKDYSGTFAARISGPKYVGRMSGTFTLSLS